MSRFFLIAFLLGSLMIFTGQSCTFRLGPPSDGGVFRSGDKGRSWEQIVTLESTSKQKKTFGNVDVSKLVIDPRDANTIYAATKRFGLFKTVNGGDSWVRIYAQDVGIVDVVPDPRSRCVLYAVLVNQLLKTSDCATTWQIAFNETRSSVILTSLAIDPRDPSTIFLTNTAGELVRSTDYGLSWATFFADESASFQQVLFDKTDNSTLFLATESDGIYRSVNGGLKWDEISTSLRNKTGALNYKFIGTLSGHNGIWYVSRGSFFRSFNAGTTWEEMPLLTPPDSTSILAATVNSTNDDELYYATASTLYHSIDSGRSWHTSPLPTSRAASYLIIDPFNGDRVFMGAQVYRGGGLRIF